MEQDQLKKGFNSGYYLAKNHPALFEKLKGAIQEKEQDYAKGFIMGSQEYEKEKSHSRTLPQNQSLAERKIQEFRERMKNTQDKDRTQGRDR